MVKRIRKYSVRASKRYRHELKTVLSRGKDANKLEEVIDILASGEALPHKYQNTRLFRFAGTSRFAYNWTLEQEKKNYEAGEKFINDYELRKRFTVFKQEADNKWLYTISNKVCKQAVKDVLDAYPKVFQRAVKVP